MKRGRLVVGTIDAAGMDLFPPVSRSFTSGVRASSWSFASSRRHAGRGAAGRPSRLGGRHAAAHRRGFVVTPSRRNAPSRVAAGGPAHPAAAVLARHPLIAYPRGSVTRGPTTGASARGLYARSPWSSRIPRPSWPGRGRPRRRGAAGAGRCAVESPRDRDTVLPSPARDRVRAPPGRSAVRRRPGVSRSRRR